VVTQFQDYRPHGTLVSPSRIVQEQGGFVTLDLRVTHAVANETVDITIPDDVRAAKETVSVDKVAEGVWFLGGGSHNSVAIELDSQIVLVEAPQYAGRARAVLEAANKLVAGKQVLSVINSHHHFDHAGGLRAAAAEGATLFTSALAKPYFETALAQGPSAVKAKIQAVDGLTTLIDANRPIEIHELKDSVHARGLLVVWLPRERLLIEADAYTPGPPDAPPPAVPNPNHLNLVQNLDRLGLAPLRIVPLHGRVVPAADLYAQVGRAPPP
jgi:glyoxylase-like metal-dependent hydrolase (beta-lactamase superfamily II)